MANWPTHVTYSYTFQGHSKYPHETFTQIIKVFFNFSRVFMTNLFSSAVGPNI